MKLLANATTFGVRKRATWQMCRLSDLTAEDYFLYAILDANDEGKNKFQDRCTDPE